MSACWSPSLTLSRSSCTEIAPHACNTRKYIHHITCTQNIQPRRRLHRCCRPFRFTFSRARACSLKRIAFVTFSHRTESKAHEQSCGCGWGLSAERYGRKRTIRMGAIASARALPRATTALALALARRSRCAWWFCSDDDDDYSFNNPEPTSQPTNCFLP